MKYLPLIWAGLWRKRARTVLTLLAVVVAFMIYGSLTGVTAGIDEALDSMSDTRLRTQSRVNISVAMPLAYANQIASVPGVEGVGYYAWFGGYYQDPSNQVQTGAMDMTRLDAVFPDLIQTSPGALDAMARTPAGALVGRDVAERYGWKIGDSVPLISPIWRRKDEEPAWIFEIVGTYELEGGIPSNEIWINYDYFDEARAVGNGTVHIYFAQIDDPSHAATIARDIDERFANSSVETQTLNEKDWIRAQINQVGDIGSYVTRIVLAVLFTLLFLTGNTMMQSVRERIPELAVLKTYGYGSVALIGLVFAESLLLCVTAAGIGLGIAAAVFPSIFQALGLSVPSIQPGVIVVGLGVAAVLAILSALPPAIRAQRLNIVDALAGR